VLGAGGILASMTPVFKRGLGGYFGNGTQYMPWIHWKDVVGVYIFMIENNIENGVRGAYNVGAGQTITQKELFQAFATAIHAPLAPFVWRIPLFVARIVLGEFAKSLVVSANTSSEQIKNVGYKYEIENIQEALADIYK
jgi:NAD dependent epimerase/dehydratase family enzyme